jgi:hypothetical protein
VPERTALLLQRLERCAATLSGVGHELLELGRGRSDGLLELLVFGLPLAVQLA